MNISRGDICYIQSNFSSGSEQWGGRPAVIVSNEANNQFSSAVEVVYLTTQPKNDLPTHVTIRSAPRESIALCEQISTVALERVGAYAGHVTDTEMAQLEIAMMISLDIRYASSAPTEEHRIQNADPVSPPREEELQAELATMTVKYETIKAMYDSLLATVLQQRK